MDDSNTTTDRTYSVVHNDEQQYSLWWADRALPDGWHPEGTEGSREECLARIGEGPGTTVGVSLRREPDLLVALLGVWKAGAAYVPLDPDHPVERLAWALSDTGAPLVLIGGTTAPSGAARTVPVDAGDEHGFPD